MKTITISATVGVGLNKQDCGTVERDFPTSLAEAGDGSWRPLVTNEKGVEVLRDKAFTEVECLEMLRRSFVIDVQRTMRPKVQNEKAKQMTILQQKALTDPAIAAMLIAAEISVIPTKENGLLADPNSPKQ